MADLEVRQQGLDLGHDAWLQVGAKIKGKKDDQKRQEENGGEREHQAALRGATASSAAPQQISSRHCDCFMFCNPYIPTARSSACTLTVVE